MITNHLTHLHYSPHVTAAAIAADLRRYVDRNQQPVAVTVRPDAEIEAGKVDGVPVTVSEKVKPEGHWWVTTEVIK